MMKTALLFSPAAFGFVPTSSLLQGGGSSGRETDEPSTPPSVAPRARRRDSPPPLPLSPLRSRSPAAAAADEAANGATPAQQPSNPSAVRRPTRARARFNSMPARSFHPRAPGAPSPRHAPSPTIAAANPNLTPPRLGRGAPPPIPSSSDSEETDAVSAVRNTIHRRSPMTADIDVIAMEAALASPSGGNNRDYVDSELQEAILASMRVTVQTTETVSTSPTVNAASAVRDRINRASSARRAGESSGSRPSTAGRTGRVRISEIMEQATRSEERSREQLERARQSAEETRATRNRLNREREVWEREREEEEARRPTAPRPQRRASADDIDVGDAGNQEGETNRMFERAARAAFRRDSVEERQAWEEDLHNIAAQRTEASSHRNHLDELAQARGTTFRIHGIPVPDVFLSGRGSTTTEQTDSSSDDRHLSDLRTAEPEVEENVIVSPVAAAPAETEQTTHTIPVAQPRTGVEPTLTNYPFGRVQPDTIAALQARLAQEREEEQEAQRVAEEARLKEIEEEKKRQEEKERKKKRNEQLLNELEEQKRQDEADARAEAKFREQQRLQEEKDRENNEAIARMHRETMEQVQRDRAARVRAAEEAKRKAEKEKEDEIKRKEEFRKKKVEEARRNIAAREKAEAERKRAAEARRRELEREQARRDFQERIRRQQAEDAAQRARDQETRGQATNGRPNTAGSTSRSTPKKTKPKKEPKAENKKAVMDLDKKLQELATEPKWMGSSVKSSDVKKLLRSFHPDKYSGFIECLKGYGILDQCETAVNMLNSKKESIEADAEKDFKKGAAADDEFRKARNKLRELRGLSTASAGASSYAPPPRGPSPFAGRGFASDFGAGGYQPRSRFNSAGGYGVPPAGGFDFGSRFGDQTRYRQPPPGGYTPPPEAGYHPRYGFGFGGMPGEGFGAPPPQPPPQRPPTPGRTSASATPPKPFKYKKEPSKHNKKAIDALNGKLGDLADGSKWLGDVETKDIKKELLKFHPDRLAKLKKEIETVGLLEQCEQAVIVLNAKKEEMEENKSNQMERMKKNDEFRKNRDKLREMRGLPVGAAGMPGGAGADPFAGAGFMPRSRFHSAGGFSSRAGAGGYPYDHPLFRFRQTGNFGN